MAVNEGNRLFVTASGTVICEKWLVLFFTIPKVSKHLTERQFSGRNEFMPFSKASAFGVGGNHH